MCCDCEPVTNQRLYECWYAGRPASSNTDVRVADSDFCPLSTSSSDINYISSCPTRIGVFLAKISSFFFHSGFLSPSLLRSKTPANYTPLVESFRMSSDTRGKTLRYFLF